MLSPVSSLPKKVCSITLSSFFSWSSIPPLVLSFHPWSNESELSFYGCTKGKIYCVWTDNDGTGANFEAFDSRLLDNPWSVYFLAWSFGKFYEFKETVFSGRDIGV
jgi:hypothetical protein